MSITARRLNRATLGRQLLLRREPLDVADAVRRVVALQAQSAASPYLALWNRLAGFDPAGLDAAFADQTVVKATLMRITLHAVRAEDYPAFHNAMLSSLRASRLNDRRYTTTGLTHADADRLAPQLLEFADRPRTKAEVEDLLAERLGDRQPRMWWALRTFAPLLHAPTGGPWSQEAGGSRRPGRAGRGRGAAGGPGRLRAVRRARVAPPARGYPRAPEAAAHVGQHPARLRRPQPRDPPPYRRLVILQNGDVLPTLLVDGHVAGVWRPVEGGIEAMAFHELPDEAWPRAEAGALVAFLADREPMVYRRYSHWWDKLPRGVVRVLPG